MDIHYWAQYALPAPEKSSTAVTERVPIYSVKVNRDDGNVESLYDPPEPAIKRLNLSCVRYAAFRKNPDQFTCLQFRSRVAERLNRVSGRIFCDGNRLKHAESVLIPRCS